jgi:hypothetical protein
LPSFSNKLALSAFIAAFSAQALLAQDLTPRAYVITPVHSNAIILTYSLYDGSILLNGAIPITDSAGRINVPILAYYHSLSFFGRSANITASLPYGVGNFQGKFNTTQTTVHRSGLLDSVFRFSLNLKGGPAMSPQEFRKWRQTTIIGVSLRMVAPTGQYAPSKLINFGANRWAFKPEVGVSRRWSNWVLDGYGAVWFFTTNPSYLSRSAFSAGTHTLSEKLVGALEAHLGYDVKPRLWFSLDGNFWFGGRTSVDGKENLNTLQRNSRIGGTASLPISKHHSLKFSYSDGAVVRYGGNFHNASVAWQYSWLGRPD